MTRLNKIYSSILDIQRTRPGRGKKEKIISLINYVEQMMWLNKPDTKLTSITEVFSEQEKTIYC